MYGSGIGPSLKIGRSVTAARPDAFDRNCLLEMRGVLGVEDKFRTAIWGYGQGTVSLFTLLDPTNNEGQFLAVEAILIRGNPPSILNADLQTSVLESVLRTVFSRCFQGNVVVFIKNNGTNSNFLLGVIDSEAKTLQCCTAYQKLVNTCTLVLF